LPLVGGSPPGTPASSTTNTGRHDIAEILLNVALSTKNYKKSINLMIFFFNFDYKHVLSIDYIWR
jgi:hypothetical protein